MAIQYKIQEYEARNLAVLRVAGILDFEARSSFQQALRELEECACMKLGIDLGRVQAISSLYLGTLTDFGARMDEGGRSVSVVMIPKLAQVSRAAGLDQALTIVERKEDG
jgi:anti-anti-sigma regulatory factor